jgi:hypothetical protein
MTNPTAPFRSEIPDEEFAALVTVETMDRLVRRAVVMLQAGQDRPRRHHQRPATHRLSGTRPRLNP